MAHDESTTQGCGTARRWSLISGAVVCARCHPPASPKLVVAWEGEDIKTPIDTQEGDVS